jgi:hypothetical protein
VPTSPDVEFGSHAAVGDGFGEGLDDPCPDPARGFRGWAG